jgi:hypothetical protein
MMAACFQIPAATLSASRLLVKRILKEGRVVEAEPADPGKRHYFVGKVFVWAGDAPLA